MPAVLRAVPEVGTAYDDPSEDLIFILLEDVEAGEGSFLIIERTSDSTGQTYAQTERHPDGTWTVEHREGDAEHHVGTVVTDLRAAHALLTGWAFELTGWDAGVTWTPVRPSGRGRLRRPRRTGPASRSGGVLRPPACDDRAVTDRRHGGQAPVTTSEPYATHYHRSDRAPFLNLSEVDDRDLAPVLQSLTVGSRRRFGPHYLALRRATEARARELFVRAGGRPVRQHPHYFVLGDSSWFAGLYDDPRAVRIPLAELPLQSTSFTWTDSITALGLGTDLGVPRPDEPWKRRLYRLDQLDQVDQVAETLGPHAEPDYEGYQQTLLDHYVEIQLWTDGPVQRHLAR